MHTLCAPHILYMRHNVSQAEKSGGRPCRCKGNAEALVRSEKACETGGESPLSLEAKPPEFRAKVMNGKV